MTSDARADNVPDRRQAQRPPIPAGAQTKHRNIDDQGTMYVPTSLCVEGVGGGLPGGLAKSLSVGLGGADGQWVARCVGAGVQLAGWVC
jgi:hypothetical protein